MQIGMVVCSYGYIFKGKHNHSPKKLSGKLNLFSVLFLMSFLRGRCGFLYSKVFVM